MKIAFLFSGQGAQYPEMMKDLYDTSESAKKVFETANESLGRSISELCFNGSQEDLNLTCNTQPCMLAADLTAAYALKEKGVKPDVVAGFSLGEYAALVYSGVIAMSDAFKMVQIRANAMQESVPPGEGAMAAMIGAPAQHIEELCAKVKDSYVVAANYNSPVQTVISGMNVGVDAVLALADQEGISTMKLAVSAPFHSSLMKPAADKLAELFKTSEFNKPQFPVYMNVDGQIHEDNFAELLVRQAMSPVRWTDTLCNMQAAGVDTFIECGPGRTLSGLVRKTLSGVTICRVEDMKTLESTLTVLEK